ncbi:MAG: hypothetical protein FJ161_01865 [Gammaproteobacteria bacterium]|nr:hypothetical protein [Gammaproteobacteria bacterium]
MKWSYKIILCALLAGCASSNYLDKEPEHQDTYDKVALQHVVQRDMLRDVLINNVQDDCMSWMRCQQDLEKVYWLFQNDQLIHAGLGADRLLEESCCSLVWPQAALLKSLLYEKKRHWNHALLDLYPILKNPATDVHAFRNAMALSSRIRQSRVSSIRDLSPEEESKIEEERVLWELFQKPLTAEALTALERFPQFSIKKTAQPIKKPTHILFMYDTLPSKAFFQNFLKSFDEQTQCQSCDILPAHVDREALRASYLKGETGIIAYDLHDAIDEECLRHSVFSLTVGSAFAPHRKSDYQVYFPDQMLLHAFDESDAIVKPQLILTQDFLEQIPVALNRIPVVEINAQNYKYILNLLLGLPNRKALFEEALSSKIHYVAKPSIMPTQILCLMDAELFRKVYNYFSTLSSQNTFFLVDSEMLEHDSNLASDLSHVLYWNHPREILPTSRDDSDLGYDLIPLMLQNPWFEHVSEYTYLGAVGAYSLNNQTLVCSREWAKS